MLEHGPILELPLSHPFFREQADAFLRSCGLRLEEVDHYYVFQDRDGGILAGAGIKADIIKCVAVSESLRSEGCLTPLISRIMSDSGLANFKVFTKPEYVKVFESLGFRLLAQAPEAVFMENGRGLEKYCEYLRSYARPGRSGVVVMNANPFTLGHQYLLEQASTQVDTLFVIPVKEDVSDFPYSERLAMIKAASAAIVLEGSSYTISAATFPTYFLKELSAAAETQMQLDLDLFSRWIMPALGASVRFVGSEPLDPLTARYNSLMSNVVEIPRLEASAGSVISASTVRAFIKAGDYASAAALCPATSHPYLLAAMAERALRLELDTPCKPGLVGLDGSGAHKDMSYDTMLRGIAALRPFWSRMALATTPLELQAIGIEAEEAMMAATGGVNTHRGAIFCLGIAIHSFARFSQLTDNKAITHFPPGRNDGRKMHKELLINHITKTAQSLPVDGCKNREGIRGARQMALEGYRELFEDWLPFYADAPERLCPSKQSITPEQQLLLKIMSTLDDTCVLKRVGYERAQDVKQEASAVLSEIAGQAGHLKTLCDRYAAEGISPGGAADMLALTIFIHSIIYDHT